MKHKKKKNLKNQNINKTHKRTPAITICCLLALVLAIGAGIYFGYDHYLYSGCTMEIDETADYEQEFINSFASPYTPTESYRINSVVHNLPKDEDDFETYSVTTNIREKAFLFGMDNTQRDAIANCPIPSEENTKFADFSKRHKNMIQSARNLVIQYIKTSDIFTNKDELITAVTDVPFYLYEESELISLNVPWVPAQNQNSAIYCNNLYDYAFCEAMFVHELIHYVRYNTTKSEAPIYMGTLYDETLVEMITDFISHNDYTNVEVEYDSYMEPMRKYISLFGAKEVLTAFFYGYNEFFETQSDNRFIVEHNAFTEIVGAYGAHPQAYEILEGFFGTWYDRQHET